MIRFPNYFSGENITIEILPQKLLDLKMLYKDFSKLPIEVRKQLGEVSKFFITFSNMNSSINESISIDYLEVIIKVPITYLGKEFIFPIISFVSDKYSLIRGYLMGFNKEIEFKAEFKADFLKFNFADSFKILFEYDLTKYFKMEPPVSLVQPFILFRDYKIDISVCDSITLDVEDYNRSISLAYEPDILLEVGSFNSVLLHAKKIYYSKDRFSLMGVRRIG